MTAEPGKKGPEGPSTGAKLWAMLRQRCPRCCKGKVFRGMTAMNDPCPVCGLIFEREPGYFFGAMYFSYALSILIMLPLFYTLVWLLPNWDKVAIVPLALVLYVPLIPFVFRYSRVMWIHFDRTVSPSEVSSHAGWLRWRAEQEEKRRRREQGDSLQ
jgi:uncharacterized protein (DUF983 family)